MPITKIAPMLQVDNMDESINYYENILGFQCVRRMKNIWANLEKDGISIMLTQRYGQDKSKNPCMTGSIYIYTDSVDEIWEELKDKTKVSYPIETFDYGMREFAIEDCNGYLLQFGQEMPEQL